MKKAWGKVLTLVLAMVMVFAMGMTAFAAKDTPHTIKITSDAPQKEDHAYSAYQVFVGTYDSTSKQLKNFAWGDGVNSDALLAALKTLDTAYADCETAAQVAAVLDGKADDSTEAKAFAEAVSKNLGTAIPATGNKTDGYTISVEGDGYYFIMDSTTELSQGDTYSSYMLQVIGDVNVKAKDSTTQSQKKVKDINDSTETTTSDWQDSADWDIGDKVPFQLKGVVADDYDKYEKYYFAFHDTEGTGLTFDNNAKVYVNGEEIASGYEVKVPGTDGCTFDVVFDDLKQVTSVKAGSVITVEYTSTLNENAVIGQKGNPNTSHIEFSNNPNGEQEGTGRTPDDTVIVFTYKTVVDKLNENKEALVGADFTLYKEVTANYTGAALGSSIKANLDEKVKADALEDSKYYIAIGGKPAGIKEGDAKGSTFTYTGIDDGNYVLVETTIPSGYNAWPAAAFTVTAVHNTDTAIDPETGKVAGTDKYVLESLTGGELFEGKVTLAPDKAEMATSIVNESGSVLPETGGMGTTIFYVLGTILVLGAGVLLITRRRMSSK